MFLSPTILSQVGNLTPRNLTKKLNLGCAPNAQSWVFFPIFQNTAFLLPLYLGLYKKLQLCSFYEMIENILPYVLNTERTLTDTRLIKIGSVIPEIFLIWTNVARTNVARTNVIVTVGICLSWSQDPTFKVWSKSGQ